MEAGPGSRSGRQISSLGFNALDAAALAHAFVDLPDIPIIHLNPLTGSSTETLGLMALSRPVSFGCLPIRFRCSRRARPSPAGGLRPALSRRSAAPSRVGMRQTTPRPENHHLPLQMKLGMSPTTPAFEPKTIARYRVALLREESTPYDVPQHCSEPFAAARFLHQQLWSWDREVMGAIFLDVHHRAIGHQLAYIGTLSRAAVEPRGILSAALLANAAGIILFHNHPSGDPTPSAEDILFTRRMVDACEILGIKLLDHIVVGEWPAYVSLRQRGTL